MAHGDIRKMFDFQALHPIPCALALLVSGKVIDRAMLAKAAMADALARVKADGYRIAATSVHPGSVELDDVPTPQPMSLSALAIEIGAAMSRAESRTAFLI